MNLIFISVATLLIGGATFWLCRILWRGPGQETDIEHHSVNAAVLRDQWTELEQDHANGTLSAKDFADARTDLQRRALAEATPSQVDLAPQRGSKRAAIALAIALPFAATASYLYLGEPAAMNPPSARNTGVVTQADVQAMVVSLEQRLAHSPNDTAGWLMLARSYRHFGRYEEAANAFENATNLIQTDPVALSEYAETLARVQNSSFEGEPTRLLERALSLNPKALMPLTLAGAAAMERRDFRAAIDYWSQLLEILPPDSESARVVALSIEQAQKEQASVGGN